MYFTRYLEHEVAPDLAQELVELSEGFSGSDIEAAIHDIASAMFADGVTRCPPRARSPRTSATWCPTARPTPRTSLRSGAGATAAASPQAPRPRRTWARPRSTAASYSPSRSPPSSDERDTMTCTFCGSASPAGSTYCDRCGQRLAPAAGAPAPAPPAVGGIGPAPAAPVSEPTPPPAPDMRAQHASVAPATPARAGAAPPVVGCGARRCGGARCWGRRRPVPGR